MLANEEVISVSNGITLTNKRLRNTYDNKEDSAITSMLLENIQSISMKHKSKPLLLLIGILLIVLSLILAKGVLDILISGVLIGGILIVNYFITKKHFLTIASSADAINIIIKGQSSTKLLEYIDQIEETICKRKEELLTTPINMR
jgi:hypothetical protein